MTRWCGHSSSCVTKLGEKMTNEFKSERKQTKKESDSSKNAAKKRLTDPVSVKRDSRMAGERTSNGDRILFDHELSNEWRSE